MILKIEEEMMLVKKTNKLINARKKIEISIIENHYIVIIKIQ